MSHKIVDPESLIYRLRNAREAYPRMLMLEKSMPKFVEEIYNTQRDAREFSEKHIKPVALELDKKIERDHSYFAWDIVKKATPYGFLSYIIPKPFSGKGLFTTHFAVLLEEMCGYDPGIANIFGAHALGLCPLLLSPDIRHYSKYMQKIAVAEKKGEPILMAIAITEPGAGSDYEDKDDMAVANLSAHARKVNGGYILNGRKVFISNGSVAKYIWVGAVMDRKRPLETTVSFVVPNDAKGFSVGNIEQKMGQRSCPAAELIFEDVFVPDEDRVGEEGEGESLVSVVLGGSRGPVGAIATGIARGALERLLEYLNVTKVNGQYLFERQWCQLMLTDLMSKLQMARQMYFDATTCCDMLGIPKLMKLPIMQALNLVPEPIMKSGISRSIFMSKPMYKFVRKLADKNVRKEDIDLIAAYSSMAKYNASDLAMEVISKCFDIMEMDGAAEEYGVEKLYRDAKLTQIYEGTNQINRVFAFKNTFACKAPAAARR